MATQHAGPLHVLIVDDDATNREVLRLMLGKLGHQADAVDDGQSAIDRCAAQRYDLVLMDVAMPIMDGFEATRRIREAEGVGPRMPILAVTAGDDERMNACREAGMDDILRKPIFKATLLAAITPFVEAKTRSLSAPARVAGADS